MHVYSHSLPHLGIGGMVPLYFLFHATVKDFLFITAFAGSVTKLFLCVLVINCETIMTHWARKAY